MKTLKRKSYEWDLELAGINTYHKASLLKSKVLANEQKDQWNGTESPETGPNTYKYLVYDKGNIANNWEKIN